MEKGHLCFDTGVGGEQVMLYRVMGEATLRKDREIQSGLTSRGAEFRGKCPFLNNATDIE